MLLFQYSYVYLVNFILTFGNNWEYLFFGHHKSFNYVCPDKIKQMYLNEEKNDNFNVYGYDNRKLFVNLLITNQADTSGLVFENIETLAEKEYEFPNKVICTESGGICVGINAENI